MIRFLRAMIWLRWRSLANSIRAGRKRDGMERLSRIGGMLVRVLVPLVFVPPALLLAIGALAGGLLMPQREQVADLVNALSRVILLLLTVAVLLGPLVRSMSGLQPELRRLLLMPIPRRRLHLAEAVVGGIDPWVVPGLVALLMLPVGLGIGGAWWQAVIVASAALMFLLALIAIGSAATSCTVLVFRDRRRAEGVTLVLLIGIACIGFVPALFGGESTVAMNVDGVDTTVVRAQFARIVSWAAPLPSEQFAATLSHAVDERPFAAAVRLASLALTALLLFAGSAWLHGRVLDGFETGGSRRQTRAGPGRLDRLPGVEAPLAALAWVVVRTATRTVRGRMAVFFTAIALGLIGAVFSRSILHEVPSLWSAVHGPLLLYVGAVFCALSLQPIMLNQFAIDGAGLTLEALAPLSSRQLVRGKLLGQLLLASISFALCAVVVLAVVRAGDPLLWCAALLCAIASFVILVPIAALLSILLPKPADLSRIGRDGNPHALAGLLGALLTAIVFGTTSALWIVPGVLGGRPALACLLALATLIGAVPLLLVLSTPISELFEQRIENLILVASNR